MKKYLPARVVALLCAVICTTVTAIELWPAARGIRTSDQNGDGQPDVWRHYDSRGLLAEVDVDSNFDGSPDIEEYYERGVLVRRESDRNFNGQADLVEEFDSETHRQTRSVVDIDYDGSADMLVLFRNGQPVFSERMHSPTRSGIPSPQQAVRSDDTHHLARLLDPFEAETALRGTHPASTDENWVGLSTSGGLPYPRFSAFSRLSLSARLVGPDVQPHAPTLLLPRSPRAPPVS